MELTEIICVLFSQYQCCRRAQLLKTRGVAAHRRYERYAPRSNHKIKTHRFLQRYADRCNPGPFCSSVRHTPMFCPEEWRYDRAVFSIR